MNRAPHTDWDEAERARRARQPRTARDRETEAPAETRHAVAARIATS